MSQKNPNLKYLLGITQKASWKTTKMTRLLVTFLEKYKITKRQTMSVKEPGSDQMASACWHHPYSSFSSTSPWLLQKTGICCGKGGLTNSFGYATGAFGWQICALALAFGTVGFAGKKLVAC